MMMLFLVFVEHGRSPCPESRSWVVVWKSFEKQEHTCPHLAVVNGLLWRSEVPDFDAARSHHAGWLRQFIDCVQWARLPPLGVGWIGALAFYAACLKAAETVS
jgi:hypothetical protein